MNQPKTPVLDTLISIGGFILLVSAGAMLARVGLAVLTSWPLFYLAAGVVVIGLVVRTRRELKQIAPAPSYPPPNIVRSTFP